MPTYAPAILSLGTVEYRLGRIAQGRELLTSLLSLPKKTKVICQIVDEARMFLTRMEAYEVGMELCREALKRYPDVDALFQGSAIAPVMCGPARRGGARQPVRPWNGNRRIGTGFTFVSVSSWRTLGAQA